MEKRRSVEYIFFEHVEKPLYFTVFLNLKINLSEHGNGKRAKGGEFQSLDKNVAKMIEDSKAGLKTARRKEDIRARRSAQRLLHLLYASRIRTRLRVRVGVGVRIRLRVSKRASMSKTNSTSKS